MKTIKSLTFLLAFLFCFLNLLAEDFLSFSKNSNGKSSYNLNNTAFGYYANGLTSCTLFKFKLGTPFNTTVIGSEQAHYFITGDWANPDGSWNFYVTEISSLRSIFRVDTATGAITNLGSISGLLSGHFVTLMVWDHTSNKFYVCSSTNTFMQLYSLNWSNKSLTAIGSPSSTCIRPELGGINSTGTFFVADCFSDNVFRLNKTTGVPTLIGPFGGAVGYHSGEAFDRSDWKFYYLKNDPLAVLLQCNSGICSGTQIGQFPYIQVISMCVVSTPSSSINQLSSEIPDSYSLGQNYPNPFNPSTIIRFKIKDLRFTSLKIYDILGKEVATLINEKLQPGEYEIRFDGSNLNSGVYFYKLISDDFSETKKMLMTK